MLARLIWLLTPVAFAAVGAVPHADAQGAYPPEMRRRAGKLPGMRQRPSPGQRVAARLPSGEASDPEAVALLRAMLRPQLEYTAEEQTWGAQGGITSRQIVKGDTRGTVVRHYLSPPYLAGDVMLTGPDRYSYFRAATKTLTAVPPSGGHEDERDQRIVNGIRQRKFVARRTGTETVAGITSTIVLVTPANAGKGGYAKFWIDPVTHIKLKVEIANEANARVSASELSSLVTGSAANVSARDFQPAQFGGGAPRNINRQKVASIQDAAAHLPFQPVQPTVLPPGFRLDSIQIVNLPARVNLFLRYTNGVSVFTLVEHRARKAPRQRPGADQDVAHWVVPVADYDIEVVYRGHLPPEQEQSVHDSLQPVR